MTSTHASVSSMRPWRIIRTGSRLPDQKKECLQRIVKVRLAQGRTAEATGMITDLLRQYPDDKFAPGVRAIRWPVGSQTISPRR